MVHKAKVCHDGHAQVHFTNLCPTSQVFVAFYGVETLGLVG